MSGSGGEQASIRAQIFGDKGMVEMDIPGAFWREGLGDLLSTSVVKATTHILFEKIIPIIPKLSYISTAAPNNL